MEYGLSKTRLYSIYSGMKQRCHNPNNQHYPWYGAKGITVCGEWLGENGLQNFFEWSLSHGYNENLTIDRIDNSKGYSPDNCRWLTASANSKRANPRPKKCSVVTIAQKLSMALSYKSMSQAELARRIGTTPSNLNQKVKRNTLTKEELEQIADVLGGTWIAEFVFPDGTKI